LIDFLLSAEDELVQRFAKILQLAGREDARRPVIAGIDAVFMR
jgi:hypothetical protein